MNKLNWSKKEFEVYVLLFAAHCNHFESKEEQDYILNRVDEKMYNKIHTEVVIDSEETNLNKIQQYLSENDFTQTEKEALIKDIKNVFFADGTVDTIEKNIFTLLKKIID
jgi:hypothetical protein